MCSGSGIKLAGILNSRFTSGWERYETLIKPELHFGIR